MVYKSLNNDIGHLVFFSFIVSYKLYKIPQSHDVARGEW